MDVPFTATEID